MTFYQYQVNEMNFLLWDVQTVTVNDYSVDVSFNERIWKEYYKYKETHPMSEDGVYSDNLKLFLKYFVEEELKEFAQKNGEMKLIEEDRL